ncbi:cory-CC-star protein [Marinimicrobium sp. ABcell2]|uniref:cory-CC-star protein n=1 Tax=Marinimicrobium sp. ABcell2 TaxID=3069751 RepID=UPI0027B4E277|nr:cory-CC-star protein [Marinimicrobium sp. ABcell2]MDQ2076436.1 cory-CC-star protein [Marinimicrobium sp. ABcell2]
MLAKLRHWGRLYRDFYEQPFRRTVALEERRRDDFFRLLVMSESLGLPNPASWYCLELMPFVVEDLHAWHQRMGMEQCPTCGFRCC